MDAGCNPKPGRRIPAQFLICLTPVCALNSRGRCLGLSVPKQKARRRPGRRAFKRQSTGAGPVVFRDYPSQKDPIPEVTRAPVRLNPPAFRVPTGRPAAIIDPSHGSSVRRAGFREGSTPRRQAPRTVARPKSTADRGQNGSDVLVATAQAAFGAGYRYPRFGPHSTRRSMPNIKPFTNLWGCPSFPGYPAPTYQVVRAVPANRRSGVRRHLIHRTRLRSITTPA